MGIRSLIATCALVSTVASAADFGVADLGTPCAYIQEREIARGSWPIPWQAPKVGGFFAFGGRAFDRDVSMLYLCRSGTLVAGNYYLPIEPLAQATTSYLRVYEELVSLYGEPLLPNRALTILGTLPEDPRTMPADRTGAMTWWRIGNVSVTQALMPHTTGEDIGWRVFIVVGPSARR
jgi:hypothetical protein